MLGAADARTLLASGTGELGAAYFGAEDYVADIGGRRSPGGEEVLYARSQVCLAAYLAGLPAIDQVITDITDDELFLADGCAVARASATRARCASIPGRWGWLTWVSTPTPDEVAHAQAVLAAGAAGVGVVDGQMVDEVQVRPWRGRAGPRPGPGGPEVSPPCPLADRRAVRLGQRRRRSRNGPGVRGSPS